jgi:hypothetical protein
MYAAGVASDLRSFIVNTEDGPVQDVVPYYYVLVEDDAGHRWVTGDVFDTETEAQAVVDFNDYHGINPGNSDTFYKSTPCYGSDAWGPEDDYELACFEADCYNEPRPQWF